MSVDFYTSASESVHDVATKKWTHLSGTSMERWLWDERAVDVQPPNYIIEDTVAVEPDEEDD